MKGKRFWLSEGEIEKAATEPLGSAPTVTKPLPPSPPLADEIQRLLAASDRQAMLKSLFWELLSFDRVNEPVPFSVVSRDRRESLDGSVVLAQCGDLYVYHFQMGCSHLSLRREAQVLDCVQASCPTALSIFSNLSGGEMDICWRGLGPARRTRRLIIDGEAFDHAEAAGVLAAMPAYDPASGRQRSALEVLARADRAFRRLIRRKRQQRVLTPYAFLGECSPLAHHQQEWLMNRWRGLRDAEAKAEMIQSNLRLVWSVAIRFIRNGIEIDDLFQEGCIALMRAVEGFDSRAGTRFSTYAVTCIKRKLMQVALRSSKSTNIVTLMLKDAISNRYFDCPYSRLETVEMQTITYRAMQALPKRQAAVLRLRFGLDDGLSRTLEEVGSRLNLTREGARQIESRALARMRRLLGVVTIDLQGRGSDDCDAASR